MIDRNRRVAEVAGELALHEYLLHKWVVDERRRMAAASLQDNRGNKQEAARALGISRTTIYRKINDYRIAEHHYALGDVRRLILVGSLDRNRGSGSCASCSTPQITRVNQSVG